MPFSDNDDSSTKKKRARSEHLVSYLNLPVSEIVSPKQPSPAKRIEYNLQENEQMSKYFQFDLTENLQIESNVKNERLMEAQKKSEEGNKKR